MSHRGTAGGDVTVVIGGGTMGAGIAQSLLEAGATVVVLESSSEHAVVPGGSWGCTSSTRSRAPSWSSSSSARPPRTARWTPPADGSSAWASGASRCGTPRAALDLAATIAERSWRALEVTKLALRQHRPATTLFDVAAQALLFESDDKHRRMRASLDRRSASPAT